MRTLRLFSLAHAEARRALASGAPVWLPVNPVEYHGPHLSLHNDRLLSEAIARQVHRIRCERGRELPFLLADDLEVGVDPTPGPGTRAVPFATVRAMVLEACRALHALGARAVIAMTWHGAPLHSLAIEPGLAWLRKRGVAALNPFNEAFRQLCRLDGRRFERAFDHVEDPAERAAMIEGLRYDFHAGFFETSMAMHLAPESVSDRLDEVPPCPPVVPDRALMRAARLAHAIGREEIGHELAMIAHGLGWYALDPFPGYTGRPHRASAQSGALFTQAVAEGYADLIDDVLAGRRPPPSPPMQWLGVATMRGRIARRPHIDGPHIDGPHIDGPTINRGDGRCSRRG